MKERCSPIGINIKWTFKAGSTDAQFMSKHSHFCLRIGDKISPMLNCWAFSICSTHLQDGLLHTGEDKDCFLSFCEVFCHYNSFAFLFLQQGIMMFILLVFPEHLKPNGPCLGWDPVSVCPLPSTDTTCPTRFLQHFWSGFLHLQILVFPKTGWEYFLDYCMVTNSSCEHILNPYFFW